MSDLPLLSERALEATATVANNRMNRERELRGTNGYDHELGLRVTELLPPGARWLDVGCGTARALFEVERVCPEVTIVGVDLVDHFWPRPALSRVSLVVSPIRDYVPDAAFDLITSVHGLHYVGDKLGVLTMLCSWLRPGGRLLAHLDLRHVIVHGRPATPRLLRGAGLGPVRNQPQHSAAPGHTSAASLRRSHVPDMFPPRSLRLRARVALGATRLFPDGPFQWNARRHLVEGAHGLAPFNLQFLGARAAGPNYTGQPAVESHYG